MRKISLSILAVLMCTLLQAQMGAWKQNGIELKCPKVEFSQGDTIQIMIASDHKAEIECAFFTDQLLMHHQIILVQGEPSVLEVVVKDFPAGKIKALLTSEGLHKEIDLWIH